MTDLPSDANDAQSTTAQPTTMQSTDALLSRLRVIEDQPLDTRAVAYVQLHDVLQSTLEGGDSARVHD